MEKFYIVTDQTKLRKEYMDYIENEEVIRKLFIEFKKEQGITSKEYYATNSSLYIVPTIEDIEKFDKVLCKELDNGLRDFKKASKINKAWIKTLKENNLKVLRRPELYYYFHVCGKFSTRLFHIGDVVYCSLQAEHDFKTPEGFTEIKASEFYKVIEDAEKGDK